MKLNNIKVQNDFAENGFEDLVSYCNWLKRKNNVALHLIEKYVGKDMQKDECLSEIRNIILDVSGDISRLPQKMMIVGDGNEGS